MTYSSTKLLNFVNSDGRFPVKFFPDNLLPMVTVVNYSPLLQVAKTI